MRKLLVAALAARCGTGSWQAWPTPRTPTSSILRRAAPREGQPREAHPAKLDFGYQVGDTHGHARRRHRASTESPPEGLVTYPAARPEVHVRPGDRSDGYGSGRPSSGLQQGQRRHRNDRQPGRCANDRTQQARPCDVKLTLINISTGDPRFPKTVSQIEEARRLAIRHRHGSAGLPDPRARGARCPVLRREDRGHPDRGAPLHGARLDSRTRAVSTTPSSRSPRHQEEDRQGRPKKACRSPTARRARSRRSASTRWSAARADAHHACHVHRRGRREDHRHKKSPSSAVAQKRS